MILQDEQSKTIFVEIQTIFQGMTPNCKNATFALFDYIS